MKTSAWQQARALALVAGAMDFCTGAGLVAFPALTLACMGVTPPGADALVFLRWVGAFVGAVGASYLLMLARGGQTRLRSVFESTILFRAAAGGYCGVAVLSGQLEPLWLSVMATDLGLVGAQLWLLKKNWGRHD